MTREGEPSSVYHSSSQKNRCRWRKTRIKTLKLYHNKRTKPDILPQRRDDIRIPNTVEKDGNDIFTDHRIRYKETWCRTINQLAVCNHFVDDTRPITQHTTRSPSLSYRRTSNVCPLCLQSICTVTSSHSTRNCLHTRS